MAINRELERGTGRRAPGRAPGVFRSVGNPLYRTNPATGNLELADEFSLGAPALEPQPVAPAAAAPGELEARSSPLSDVGADGGQGNVGAAPDADAAAASTDAPGGTASVGSPTGGGRNTGTGRDIGMGMGAAIGGIPGMIAGMVLGQMAENALSNPKGAQPAGEPVGTISGFNNLNLGQPGGFTPPGMAPPKGFEVANLGVPTGATAEDSSNAGSTSSHGSQDSTASAHGMGEATGDSPDSTSSDSSDSSSDSGDSGGGDGYAAGGVVTADRLQGPDPAGPDDGSAPLDEGEFVVNAQAAAQNLPALEAINAQGGAQGAQEFQTMQWFVENVLSRTEVGQKFAAELDQALPLIQEAIAQRPDGQQILQRMVTSYLQPAADAVRRGQYDEAVRLLGEMGTMAAELAAEVDLDPELEQLLEEFAQDSAEVTHDGELASLATATGNELVHPGDQVASQPASRLGRIFVGG